MENKPTFQTTVAKEITLEGVGLTHWKKCCFNI